jgi:hypothetical protein
LGPDAGPRALGQGGCKTQGTLICAPCTQATWARRTLLAPSFLDLEEDVKSKLIIIIIIIIITIDFIPQIKSMFFYCNNIYFKFNNINEFNNINNYI